MTAIQKEIIQRVGIKIPKSYTYEYLDSEGNWKEVPNPSSYGMEMDKFNNTTFDEITTKSIRVTLNKQANDTNGVGVMEWKVYGTANMRMKTIRQIWKRQ